MLKIICIIVFGFIISMFITYFIAVRTSSLKKMSDEDILENIDKKLNYSEPYIIKSGTDEWDEPR